MHENGKGIHGNLDGALTVVATPPKSPIQILSNRTLIGTV